MTANAATGPFTLAACAEMIYRDRPLLERIEAITARGLEVEIWDWTKPDKDLRAMAATGAVFGSMTGYVSGTLTDEEGARAFLESAKRSTEAAAVLGCTRLNFHGTGLGPTGLPVEPVEHVTGAMWARAALTLTALAELGGTPASCSPWRTSTCRSTTRARPSPTPRTPWRWSLPSTPPRCA